MGKIAELNVSKRKIAELIPNPKNPNTHSEKQISKLSHSIKKHGFVKGSVVIQKSTSMVIAGHGIIEALKKLGYTEVDVIETDLTDEQANAFLIADNHIASQSTIDDLALQKLIRELSDNNVPAIDFGFDQDDLDALAGRIVGASGGYQADEKDDDVPEVKEAITQKGDLWTLGKHRVLCGDSTVKESVEKLMNGQKADMVFTDPPYDFDKDFLSICFDYCDQHVFVMDGDKNHVRTTVKYIDKFNVFYVVYFDAQTWNLSKLIPLTQHLLIAHYHCEKAKNRELNMLHSVIHISTKNDRAEENYKAKRIEAIAPFIDNFSDEDNIVLDLFGGSGSVLIASHKLKRRCFMMEKEPSFCDVILKRFCDFTKDGLQINPVRHDGFVFQLA